MADTRNTPAFTRIVQALRYSSLVREIALRLLDEHFENDLLLIAGNIQTVENAAKELRLDINNEECGEVAFAIKIITLCCPHQHVLPLLSACLIRQIISVSNTSKLVRPKLRYLNRQEI